MNKVEKFSSNPGKLHFEELVHLLIYIRDNNNLDLNYYAHMKYSPLSDLLRQASIYTENQLISLSDYSWKDCTETGRSTGEYIILYQCGKIDHGKHLPGPVAQSSA